MLLGMKVAIAVSAILLNLLGIIVLAKLTHVVKEGDSSGYKSIFLILSSGFLCGFSSMLEVVFR